MKDLDYQIVELPGLGKRVVATQKMIEFYGKDKFSVEDPELEYKGKIYRAIKISDWNRITKNS